MQRVIECMAHCLVKQIHHRYMAGILPIRRKTQDNQSINQSINESVLS